MLEISLAPDAGPCGARKPRYASNSRGASDDADCSNDVRRVHACVEIRVRAALCRRHHRVKTHGGWTYTPLEPGVYLWTSRHGYQYLRDHHGTHDVSADRRRTDPPD